MGLLMNKECEQFKGVYCAKIGMHVPKNWCINVCQGEPETYQTKPKKKRKVVKRDPPTLLQMGAHFTKAMVRRAKKGFAVVSKEEYVRRRTICSKCSGGWKCPKCRCMLWAKSALETENCEKWEQ